MLLLLFLPEIGSKISSFFGGSKEDENKDSKVEVCCTSPSSPRDFFQ